MLGAGLRIAGLVAVMLHALVHLRHHVVAMLHHLGMLTMLLMLALRLVLGMLRMIGGRRRSGLAGRSGGKRQCEQNRHVKSPEFRMGD
jgi:hypothetical protein